VHTAVGTKPDTATPTASPTATPTPTPTATPTPTPTATPTATPTPTPTATVAGNHDARLKKISASGSVVLSDGQPDLKNLTIQVRNEGDHTDSIGVYVDIVPPGGISNPYGCTPIGRVINTVVSLAPGAQTTVSASLSFSCANVAGATGQTYTIMAAADAHADDGGACGPFQIQSLACNSALADEDNDATDNRATTNAFTVK